MKIKNSLKKATLCFVQDGNKVLLGMKKRGFAEGRWNGFGGKVNEGESVLKATIREVQEEALITPKYLKKHAILDFYFINKPDWNQQVHVYLTNFWEGTPSQTDEMLPKWFKVDNLPFQDMWADDRYWLPLVLEGKKLKGKFLFDEKENIIDKKIKITNLKNLI